jgi:hypothetical protein
VIVAPYPLCRSVQRHLIAGDEDDVGAFSGECVGDRVANPPARAGHHGTLTGQLKVHASPLSHF